MEQVVLGIFQEQLSKVIIGFRKEQINANLLNGKGEIRDVSLNCQMLNETLARFTPYIELQEIHVSRLGFHVTSWTNLRKAPIIVDIGHITAKVQEPLRCLPRHQRRKLEMITEKELIAKMLTEGFKPLRAGKGSYGLVDRIVDNMTIEMESLTLEFQTWGKFKTQRVGPWTPPALVVKAHNLKVVMVDEEGNEGTPDQVWNHNRNQREKFMLYKKIYGECQVLLRPNDTTENAKENEQGDSSADSSILKLAETRLEVQMAVQRRLRDGAILAVQMDTTLPSVDVTIDASSVRELAHFAAGLQYCFAKDRSFDDPLRSKAESGASEKHAADAVGPTVRMLSRLGTSEEEDDDANGGDDNKKQKDASLMNRDRADTGEDSVEGTASVGNASADVDAGSVASWQSEDDRSFVNDSAQNGRTFKSAFGSMSSSRHTNQGSNRPVIILPNALVIYKSVSFTCAVHDLSLRGFYPHVPSSSPTKRDVCGNDDDGYIEFIAKGCVAEILWPKVEQNDPAGFYVQLSTSFVSLQERFGQRKRTVLLGGMQRDDHLSLHLPSGRPQEIGADEFFPLFERRGIRDDPLDLRHLFPTQAFGVKMTVDVLKQKVPSDNDSLGPGEVETKYKVLHEMGVDEMDIVLDSDIFYRMVRFFLDQGFDKRWHTGDWVDFLAPEMLLHPSEELELELFLQEPTEVFLDEHQMISSDLFNVTARLTNVEMKIPSAVHDNLRACDIALKWKETTCVVSSALPKTFLSGKISNSITGDALEESKKGAIDFPNDPSDTCFQLQKVEDPNHRPIGSEEKAVSTFRLQVTVRGFEMNLVPTIPFCTALEPRLLLAISNSTAILCFEGEPPTDDSNQIKITLFIQVLVHDLTVNLDLDLLAGSAYTLLHHKNAMVLIAEMIRTLFQPVQHSDENVEMPHLERMESGDSVGIKKSLKGRSILVRRHISQSRETGGLAIVFCMQHNNLTVRGWRQNVPVKSPLRDMTDESRHYTEDGGLVDLLSLFDFSLTGFEVGVEFDFHVDESRRTVVKCYLDTANLRIADIEEEMTTGGHAKCMMDFCTLGDAQLNGLDLFGNTRQFALRLEGKHTRDSQSWSLAADITSPSRIHLHVEALKNVALLTMEALLLPAWSKSSADIDSTCSSPFPPETIGYFFYSLFIEAKGSEKNPLSSLNVAELDIDGSSEPIVERYLRAICRAVLPSDLHVILLRCELANLLLSIPSVDNAGDKRSLSLHLIRSVFISRFYPVSGSTPGEIEKVLACPGMDWSTLIDRDEKGFFQKVISRQALLSLADVGDTINTAVHPFGLDLMYTNGTVEVSMSEGLRIDDIQRIERFQSRLKAAVVLCTECFSELLQVANSMKNGGGTKIEKAELTVNGDQETTNGVAEKVDNPADSFSSSRRFLQKASEELLQYEEEVRNAICKRDDELELLKISVFKKERERFGAVALLSSRVAGWLRMGGQHRTGDRVARKSIMWPYWAVLRKELLIIYASPGSSKPTDILSLVNAQLRQLAGGKSKQDIKRGFAIVEKNGMTRYFIAGDAPGFALWIKEITKTIRMCSDASTIAEMEDEAVSAFAVDAMAKEDIDGYDMNEGGEQKRGLGNRLASSFQSAKLKAKEMSERRTRTESAESLDDSYPDESDHARSAGLNLSEDGPERNANTRRAQFGKKLSGVGQVTKSRLGSAIQSARQKGAEISTKRMNSEEGFNEERLSGTSIDLANNPDAVSSKRLQLANRFGNAIQSTKAVRLSGIRNKIGGIGQRQVGPEGELAAASNHSRQDEESWEGSMPESWKCEKCTFINHDSESCEMCGSTRAVVHSGTVQNSLVQSQSAPSESTSQRALSDISETSEMPPDNNRRSFVQSTSLEQNSTRSTSRFGFRKSQETSAASLDDSVFGGESLALKNVCVGRQGFQDTSGPDHTSIPLKQLEGRWTVVVSSIPFETHSNDGDGEANSNDNNKDLESPVDDSLSRETIDKQNDQQVVSVENTAHQETGVSSGIAERPWKSEPSHQRLTFKIKVCRSESVAEAPHIEKALTRGDVLKFFSGISEAVEAVLPQLFEDETYYEDSSNDTQLGSRKSQLAEKVLIFGRLLGGLLEHDGRSDLLEYQGECVQGFFNALLDCPLPIDALSLLSETLGLCASTTDFKSSTVGRPDDVNLLSREGPAKILGLLSACHTELQRVENTVANFKSNRHHVEAAPSKAREKGSTQELTRSVCYQSILPPSLTNKLHDSVHDALLNIMAERDEANAQLIGSNVMHVHFLERERKQIEKLQAEKKMREDLMKIQARTDLNQPNLANLFGGRPDDRVAKMRNEIDLKLEAFHQIYRSHATTDEEITGLCTQLANEISTKTSHALEIERLKATSESRRKTNNAEKNSMADELRKVKDLLASEQSKRAELQKEAEKWKNLYEDAKRQP